MTSDTEARRSVAMTGAPFSVSTPSIVAVWPSRWMRAPSLATRQKEQKEVLARAAGLVKPGGRLVYVTCSLLPDENRGAVDWLRRERQEFALEPTSARWPSTATTTVPASADGASAKLTVHAATAYFGDFEYSTTLNLSKTGGRWFVAWSPAVIHPDLAGGRHFKSSIQRAARGSILDRNGAPHDLAVGDAVSGLQAGPEPVKLRLCLGGNKRVRMPQHFVRAPPEETLGGGIAGHHALVGVERDDRDRRVLDNRCQNLVRSLHTPDAVCVRFCVCPASFSPGSLPHRHLPDSCPDETRARGVLVVSFAPFQVNSSQSLRTRQFA